MLINFTEWLDRYGEKSWDFQSVYAGAIGGRAKAFYYRHRLIGTAAVAPIRAFVIMIQAYHPTHGVPLPERLGSAVVPTTTIPVRTVRSLCVRNSRGNRQHSP